MTITIELSPETEARLTAEAAERGISAEALAGRLLEQTLVPYTPGTGRLSAEDLERLTDVLTEGSENVPILPPEVNNRESYYEDRW
ncbi:MAG TPA: hypothetical protein VG225_01910 [Terracidiphilus sp.]|jgi:hypothetical protein|nr:hypothetical protein [Terracidiphilus sp.]